MPTTKASAATPAPLTGRLEFAVDATAAGAGASPATYLASQFATYVERALLLLLLLLLLVLLGCATAAPAFLHSCRRAVTTPALLLRYDSYY